MIALGLGRVSCLEVFRQMRSDASAVQKHTSILDTPVAVDGKRSQNFDHEGENSNTHHLDNRIPFIPCSHAGPCDKDAGCSCHSNRTSCERICGCAKTCGRRYQGCTCGAKNNSVCFQDQRCLCWRLNRECDPWLCGTCGVLEVLDPVNRYNEEIQSNHCKNAKLQRDVPRRTLKGKSDVQGWGLFAGEDMKRHEYIGEYKGEVVGEQESNRRGAVYHHRGLEYLFNLNKGQEIDSSRAGNKMRFINNSCKPHIINVEAKKMFCNGVQRIMLFSKKHIDAGEELFFNYGYPKSVTKNFWERDEGPGQGGEEDEPVREEAAGAGPTTTRGPGRPRKKGVGRRISSKKQSRSGGRWVKSALEVESPKDVADSDEEAHSFRTKNNGEALRSSSRRKRKRSEGGHEVDHSATPADEPDVAEGHGDGNGAAGLSFQGAPEIAESGDDEFEDDLASQESSSTGDSDEEDDLEEEEEVTSDSEVVRQRRISAGDTRYGGKSQRLGWATRRLKAAQAAEIASAPRPKKTRGKRSARGSWLGTGGRPPKKRGK
jgi:SET domain/CXC domain